MRGSRIVVLLIAVVGSASLRGSASYTPSLLEVKTRPEARRGDALQTGNRVEDIYITRNVRTSRTAPTSFCAAAGFMALYDEVYEYHAAETDPSGAMTSTHAKVLGELRACLVQSDATTALLYGKGILNGVTFTTHGSCIFRRDLPTSGFIVARCSEELTDLPAEYVGGQLVTNALSSSTPVGPNSSPPGYIQSGVTIFRLWRKPNNVR
jgi:hypothetical protein